LRFFKYLLNPEKYDKNTVPKYSEKLKLAKFYGSGLIQPPIPLTPYYLLNMLQVIK